MGVSSGESPQSSSRRPIGRLELIMAAFMVGKSLKDRRQTKAIEELFDKADKNGNGKISVEEYVMIFSDHGITLRYTFTTFRSLNFFLRFERSENWLFLGILKKWNEVNLKFLA